MHATLARFQRTLFVPIVAALCLLSVGISANAGKKSAVPVPQLQGPISGGIYGWPLGVSARDPADYGYTEDEYFVSGTATAADGSEAPYTTRFLVLRPKREAEYRGTILVEWLNVTSQMDTSPVFSSMHEHIFRAGYTYVAVSAQKAGIDGSPLALKFFDPVRYAAINHPGDKYAFDMFSQIAQALRHSGDKGGTNPDPMGGFKTRRLIATGQSQSASRMRAYINDYPELASAWDGFIPVASRVEALRDDIAPVLWINTENEAGGSVPRDDGGMFMLWELSGVAHADWWTLQYGVAAGSRSRFGPGSGNYFDRTTGGQYGEIASGACPQAFMPARYAYEAALDHIDAWVRHKNNRPPVAPRIDRDPLTANIVRDANGNARGGLRLPPIDVPIATYTGDRCGLFGDTVQFDPVTLLQLYPTHAGYVAAMQTAIAAALGKGYMLTPGAEDLMQRVRASRIGKP